MNSLTYPHSRFRPLNRLFSRLRLYWSLIKDLQTGLLVLTALAGYISGCCLNPSAGSLLELASSLFLAVSGSTVLNMVYDRDIDARMPRTAARPLPSGLVSPREGLILGLLLTTLGVVWAMMLNLLYGLVVLAGVSLDVILYTLLLKRRTPYSILLGGLAGSMPALAGRTLAVGQLDSVGLLLALGILLWIPTHIMTFSIKYAADYRCASIPTFPAAYGVRATRIVIAVSSALSVFTLLAAAQIIGVLRGTHIALALLGLLLIGLVLFSLIRPNSRLNFILYKGASIYMLITMLLLIAGGF